MKKLVLTMALIVSACSEADDKVSAINKVPDAVNKISATVKDCEIWFVEDSSTGGQKRMRVFAASSAQDGLERAATATYLALKAIEWTKYDFVDMFLVPKNTERDRSKLYSGKAIAWVRYTPSPEKIPFMEQKWEIKYKIGGTTKVFGDGLKEYEFLEKFIELNGTMSLTGDANDCQDDENRPQFYHLKHRR